MFQQIRVISSEDATGKLWSSYVQLCGAQYIMHPKNFWLDAAMDTLSNLFNGFKT